ncbi:DUF1638 domain-containing protein [Labrys miyagiensis]|uniref:DUF1638 domain-containing protein n=1 Tax=Labrys miyagiensis TaxID=346912 RepID=UPI003D6714C3
MEAVTETSHTFRRNRGGIAILACGALAREIIDIVQLNRWKHVDVQCLPAHLHHRPSLIPPAVRTKLKEMKPHYDQIVVAYGDCGTSGELDAVLAEAGVDRIAGPHCFAFYDGINRFGTDPEDITTFYLTDFFCRHFERFVWQAFGLNRRSDMVEFVFGHYRRLVYLAQNDDEDLHERAQDCARRLGLSFERRPVGYGDLLPFLKQAVGRPS